MKINNEELLVLYDLSLSLKNTDDLDHAIRSFSKRLSKKLNLRSFAIHFNKGAELEYKLLESKYFYPRNYEQKINLNHLSESEFQVFNAKVSFLQISKNDEFHYIFRIKEFGLIFLEKMGEPLSAYIPELLVPTLEKLMEVCEAYKYRMQLEESREIAEKMSRIKTEFLAVMSHEMRTPLNGILGFTELLGLERLTDTQSEYIDKVHFSANTLLSIINDILDFTKLDENNVTLENVNFDLKTSIGHIVDLVESSYRFNENTFKIVYDENLPHIFCSDKIRISQILFNLISNAFKFTSKGLIEVIAKKTIDNKVSVSIKDNGIGIEREKQKDLFKAFNQLDISTTRKYGGTGLGLAICKKIINLFGGDILVTSEKGKGSCFEVILSLDLENKKAIDTENVQDINNYSGKKILVVEDNKVNLEMLKRILLKLECHPLVALNGQEAYEISLNNDFDLIFMDMRMPIMDGPSAAKKILKIKGKEKTPIVALTANTSSDDKATCFDSGMVDYIAKPFKIKDIKNCLLKYLGE